MRAHEILGRTNTGSSLKRGECEAIVVIWASNCGAEYTRKSVYHRRESGFRNGRMKRVTVRMVKLVTSEACGLAGAIGIQNTERTAI